jgi:hypothetical protein
MKTTFYFFSSYYDNNSQGLKISIEEVQKKKNDFLQQTISEIEKIDSEELIPVYGHNHSAISFILKLTYFPKTKQ